MEISAFAGLADALKVLTILPIIDVELTLVTVQLPSLSPISFYACQNPAFGYTTSGYVQRDSRRCGEPLEPGETATLHVQAYSQNDELDVLPLFNIPHFEAGIYQDGDPGAGTGGWRQIGAVARSASDGDVHTYEGSVPLDSEAAEYLSGEGDLRMLSRGNMLGVIPMFDQLASLTPPCGCVTDSDCDGGTCTIEPGSDVGECSDEQDTFVVFQANGLTFDPPGTNQALVGTECEDALARNVTLRGVADTAVLNDGVGLTITQAELYLDGAVIAQQSLFDTKVSLTAVPMDLTEGTHALSLVLRGVRPDNTTWEDTVQGTFPVVVDVEACDCPEDPCTAFNADCGTLETPCGTFDCGRGCQCIGNTCAGECPPETPRWNELSGQCEACPPTAPTWDPVNQACQAQCDGTVSESGNDGGPFFFSVEVGETEGTFSISGDNGGSVDDIVTVIYEGQELYTTGCTASTGWASGEIPYSGESTVMTVRVDTNCANESGTYWAFTLNCG